MPLADAAADLATLRRALGANRTARGAGGGAFALDEDNDCLVLVRRLPVEGTSPAALAEAIAALAEAAGRFLAAASVRPVVAPAMPAGLRA